MAGSKRWSDLDEGTRRFVVVAGVLEGLLKIAALTDLARRPAAQVRGRKWVWAVVLVVVNSAGGAPLAYFLLGRRR
jgi:Phospholipase_D-nuclease N-terminal